VPPKPLLTTGEAARALSVSVQTVRNWVATGRLEAVARGARMMLPREVVAAEVERPWGAPSGSRRPDRAGARHTAAQLQTAVRALPRSERIYAWMEQARLEGVHFPLDEYNASIPQRTIEAARRRAAPLEVPAPWNEHFRPATEDDVLALVTGAR
jgi:excisionase family DNA binding protein